MSTPSETLPSTSATLGELSLGALLATGHVQGQATIKHRVQIDPFKFGLKQDEDGEYGNHSERMYFQQARVSLSRTMAVKMIIAKDTVRALEPK